MAACAGTADYITRVRVGQSPLGEVALNRPGVATEIPPLQIHHEYPRQLGGCETNGHLTRKRLLAEPTIEYVLITYCDYTVVPHWEVIPEGEYLPSKLTLVWIELVLGTPDLLHNDMAGTTILGYFFWIIPARIVVIKAPQATGISWD